MVVLPKGYRYASGYVGLSLPLLKISPVIEIDNKTLIAKSEFHMSILSVKKYAPLLVAEKLSATPEIAEERVLKESIRLLSSKPVLLREFSSEIRVAEERDKKTVIVMCYVDGAEEFFAGIQKSLGLEIATQPFHVTLYTRSNGMGIGLTSKQEVAERTRILTPEEMGKVKIAINIEALSQTVKNS